MKYFLQLDFVGDTIDLVHEKRTRTSTFLGSVLTMSIGIICAVFGFIEAINIFSRKTYNLSLSNYYEDISRINATNNFPFSWGIWKLGQKAVVNQSSYFTITPRLWNVSFDSNGVKKAGPIPLKTESCKNFKNDNLYGKRSEYLRSAFSDDIINNVLECLDQTQDLNFLNLEGEKYQNHFFFTINACDNSTSKVMCKPIGEIENMLADAYLAIATPNYNFDNSNFTNPEQFYVGLQLFKIDAESMSKILFKYNKIIYNSNNGIISNEIESKTFYQMETGLQIVYPKRTGTQFGSITLVTNHVNIIYNRNYTKIQNVFAEIGGIANALYILFYITNMYFSKKLFKLNLYDKNFKDIDFKKIQRDTIKNKLVNSILETKGIELVESPSSKKARESEREKENPIIFHSLGNRENSENEKNEKSDIIQTINNKNSKKIEESNNNLVKYSNNNAAKKISPKNQLHLEDKQKTTLEENLKIGFWNILCYCAQSENVKAKIKYADEIITEMLEVSNLINNQNQVFKILHLLEEEHSEVFHPEEIILLQKKERRENDN